MMRNHCAHTGVGSSRPPRANALPRLSFLQRIVRGGVIVLVVLLLTLLALRSMEPCGHPVSSHMITYTTLRSLQYALETYHTRSQVFPASLTSLYPDYYTPSDAFELQRDRVERDGMSPVIYVYIDSQRVLLVGEDLVILISPEARVSVLGERYHVFR
jgi:hypothetical protein